jgi:hypothetical protein
VNKVVDALHAIRRFFTSNLGLKASALGIAILMFSLVHGAEDMERNVYIDVVVRPPADAADMILVTETPDRVRVRLKGSRARLNAIRQENLPPVDVTLKVLFREGDVRSSYRRFGRSGRTAVADLQMGPARGP